MFKLIKTIICLFLCIPSYLITGEWIENDFLQTIEVNVALQKFEEDVATDQFKIVHMVLRKPSDIWGRYKESVNMQIVNIEPNANNWSMLISPKGYSDEYYYYDNIRNLSSNTNWFEFNMDERKYLVKTVIRRQGEMIFPSIDERKYYEQIKAPYEKIYKCEVTMDLISRTFLSYDPSLPKENWRTVNKIELPIREVYTFPR